MFSRRKEKIFCIGLNKTGTTTLEAVLEELGYKLGDQTKAELLIDDWNERYFTNIIKFTKSATAFQDVPFSLPYTFMVLDQYYPNAKFVLTIRDNFDEWYKSITRFHSKLWADGERIPTAVDLKGAPYRYRGWAYKIIRYMFGTDDKDLYNRNKLEDYYHQHNQSVIDYFKGRDDKLVVINVSEDEDYIKLCEFLDKIPIRNKFPWKNKT